MMIINNFTFKFFFTVFFLVTSSTYTLAQNDTIINAEANLEHQASFAEPADVDETQNGTDLSEVVNPETIVPFIAPELTSSIYEAMMQDDENIDHEEYYAEFKEFNVPMEMTPRVRAYIKYFTERIPDITQNWLNRANKYMYVVRDIFIKEGIPTNLVALGFTESGFNTHAISRAGAGGMWQFIPSTGRIYGMNIDFWVDERRDFEQSTHAAARYLKKLYERFGDWYLALAAYNAGPGKIIKATKIHNTKDFFKISNNRRTLKLETRDYVPKFLALLIIYENYLKYGFTSPNTLPLLYDTIEVSSQTNTIWLAKKLGVDHNELVELNPALKLPMTPPRETYPVRVPYGMGKVASEIIAEADVAERAQFRIYEAKEGEKLSTIAIKYKVGVDTIKKDNALKHDKILKSRPLFIKISDSVDDDITTAFSEALSKTTPKYYTVKRGDTFIDIAHRHGLRQYDLVRLNPGINVSRIHPGQQIAVSEGYVAPKGSSKKRG